MLAFIDHPQFGRQVALEKEMAACGAEMYRKRTAKAQADRQEATTQHGSYLVRRAVKAVSEGIDAFLSFSGSGKAGPKHVAGTYLRQIPSEVAAFLTLRCCLNLISANVTLQNAAITVATALETEARLAHFEKENKQEYRNATKVVEHASNERYRRVVYSYIAGKNAVTLPTWPKRDKLLLGQKLIEIVVDTTGYIEIVPHSTPSLTRKERPGSYTYMMAGSSRCLEWIEQRKHYAELVTPEYLPTIIPPRPWTSPYEGGYYTLYKPLKLVKTGGPNYMEELSLCADDMPLLYEALNAMQSTGYVIHSPVLEVMRQLWESGGDVAGIPNRDAYSLPLCPFCGAGIPPGQNRWTGEKHACFIRPEAAERLQTWKREAASIYERNISTLSKRFQFAKTLSIAERFASESALYFPMQLDFRGRAYAVPSYLTPQGADFSKALLLFSEEKALNTPEAVQWLAIHGSGVWGNDKVSLEDRHAWVLQHETSILAVAENPYDNRMWQEADKPWQFLAFCYEWAGYAKARDAGKPFFSRLPVAMDGTCNGLQIFSLMLRDPVGGAATNLLPAATPQDIYQIVADKTVEKLRTRAVNGTLIYRKDTGAVWYDEKVLSQHLLALGVTRKSTKRQVMVLPYGGTFQACCEYTLDHLKERIDTGEAQEHGITRENSFAASRFLAGLIWESIDETVVAARSAMTFMQQLASLAAAEGLPITWTTPIGFLVNQAYFNLKEYRVKTRLGASTIRLVIREDGEALSIDKRRQRNGISPNFVHSLDAAAMFLSISLARTEGVSSFMMVHDSYGTHAADAPAMASCLRQAFVSLFTDRDVLADLRDEVSAMLPEKKRKQLPDLPEKGTLDINKVLQSAFFFA